MSTEIKSQITDTLVATLGQKFPGAVQAAPEKQEGLIVDGNRLVEVATYLRDEEGYTYLSSVTGVDYP